MAILGGTLSTEVSNQLKPCAYFELRAELCLGEQNVKYPIFRDPAGLDVLGRIATGLLHRGYKITGLGAGKGIDAGFECQLSPECEITVILYVKRTTDRIRFDLQTFRTYSLFDKLFKRRNQTSAKCGLLWHSLCSDINEVISEVFDTTRVLWVTAEESDGKS